MAYDLIDLNYSSNPQDCCYFFDTNVLLPVLGLPPSRPEIEQYLTFFNKVYSACKASGKNKIYTCTNQLSELFNILMHFEMKKIYGPDQQRDYPDIKRFYKSVFRPSGSYSKAFALYRDEFLSYSEVFALVEVGSKQPLTNLLSFDAQEMDLNDYFIYDVVRQTSAVLVSDDADFYGADLRQATFNRKVIRKFRSSSVVKKETF